MHTFVALGLFGQSGHEWVGIVAGGVVGVVLGLVIGVVTGFFRWVVRKWQNSRPIHLLLERVAEKDEPVIIVIRDFFIPPVIDAQVQMPVKVPVRFLWRTREVERQASGAVQVPSLVTTEEGHHPNVNHVWSRAEGRVLSDVEYVLGAVQKRNNVRIVEMRADAQDREWDCSLFVFGALSGRTFEFYKQMKGVAFSMSRDGITDETKSEQVQLEDGYDYGIILKARNPLRVEGGSGTGFLMGGMGVLGTEAAGYYFRSRHKELARDFGNRTFGVVVRAAFLSGARSAVRLPEYDRATEPKGMKRKVWETVMFVSRKQVDMTP